MDNDGNPVASSAFRKPKLPRKRPDQPSTAATATAPEQVQGDTDDRLGAFKEELDYLIEASASQGHTEDESYHSFGGGSNAHPGGDGCGGDGQSAEVSTADQAEYFREAMASGLNKSGPSVADTWEMFGAYPFPFKAEGSEYPADIMIQGVGDEHDQDSKRNAEEELTVFQPVLPVKPETFQ